MTNDTQRLVADEDQWLKGTWGTQLTPNCFYFNLYPKLDHHRAVSYYKFHNQIESHHSPSFVPDRLRIQALQTCRPGSKSSCHINWTKNLQKWKQGNMFLFPVHQKKKKKKIFTDVMWSATWIKSFKNLK